MIDTDGSLSDREYLRWLYQPEALDGGGYKLAVSLCDGRWVGIKPLLFHWTMHIGRFADQSGYDERYCYKNYQMAVDALNNWLFRGLEGEPNDWHRHPASGRRRPDGDASKEYIDR